ncbi:hypothetical protein EGM85_12420, partial [Macrococcus caseolyticus]
RSLLDEQIQVKLRDNRELQGTLHAYDEHCNLVLGNTEETVYTWSGDNTVQAEKSDKDMLFIRGDQVIYIRNAESSN